MKVYLFEIQRMGGDGEKIFEVFRQVLGIADDEAQARAHVLSKYPGWHVAHSAEVLNRPVHFTLGEIDET